MNSEKRIIFFGDDTWIKLFPDHFDRHDGTTSFFVTDFTEVRDLVGECKRKKFLRGDVHVNFADTANFMAYLG